MVPFPIPNLQSKTADLSFAGVGTFLNKNIYGKDISKPRFEREARSFEGVKDLVDLAAAA